MSNKNIKKKPVKMPGSSNFQNKKIFDVCDICSNYDFDDNDIEIIKNMMSDLNKMEKTPDEIEQDNKTEQKFNTSSQT